MMMCCCVANVSRLRTRFGGLNRFLSLLQNTSDASCSIVARPHNDTVTNHPPSAEYLLLCLDLLEEIDLNQQQTYTGTLLYLTSALLLEFASWQSGQYLPLTKCVTVYRCVCSCSRGCSRTNPELSCQIASLPNQDVAVGSFASARLEHDAIVASNDYCLDTYACGDTLDVLLVHYAV